MRRRIKLEGGPLDGLETSVAGEIHDRGRLEYTLPDGVSFVFVFYVPTGRMTRGMPVWECRRPREIPITEVYDKP